MDKPTSASAGERPPESGCWKTVDDLDALRCARYGISVRERKHGFDQWYQCDKSFLIAMIVNNNSHKCEYQAFIPAELLFIPTSFSTKIDIPPPNKP